MLIYKDINLGKICQQRYFQKNKLIIECCQTQFINYNFNIKLLNFQEFYKVMNLSPSKIVPQSNLHVPHQVKPRIAFTYQINQPSNINTTQIHTINKNQQANGQVLTTNVINAYSVNKNMCTPKKITDKEKQNVQISHNKKPQNKTITNVQPNLCKNNQLMGNRYGNEYKQNISKFAINNPKNNSISKQKQPRLGFPPVSPKQTGKKTNHNRSKTGSTSNQNTLNNINNKGKCPSFLAQKHKNQQIVGQNTNNTTILNKIQVNFGENKRISIEDNGKYCQCGQIATHKADIKQLCCYKCGISKMFSGHELTSLDTTSKKQQTIEVKQSQTQKNSSKSQILSKIVQNQCMSLTNEKLLKQIEQQKKNIIKYYKQNLQIQDQNIKTFYKQRKQQLRNHYQKIKSALKISIQLDLAQLQIMEKQQISQWKKSINLMEEDLKKIYKIQTQLKQSITSSSKIVIKQFIEEYQDIITRSKYDNKLWRVSKLEAQSETMNLSGISNLTSQNISGLNITILLKNFNPNVEVYKPELYRMVCCAIKSELSSPRPSDLGSQTNPHPGSQSCYEQEVEQNNTQINQQNVISQKTVLFSFEGQKC